MKRAPIIGLLFLLLLTLTVVFPVLADDPARNAGAQREGKPNIVWILVDDMSCHFGYQGEKLVETPHVDQLAREGVIFSNAYATAPVCSAHFAQR